MNEQFCLDNAGKTIGSGVCWELAIEAIKQGHPKDYYFVYDNRDKFEIKDLSKVIPGDIVILMNMLGSGSETDGHVGVVMVPVIDSVFCYADQNRGDDGEPIKKVMASDGHEYEVFEGSKVAGRRFFLRDVKKGTVKFYRF